MYDQCYEDSHPEQGQVLLIDHRQAQRQQQNISRLLYTNMVNNTQPYRQ